MSTDAILWAAACLPCAVGLAAAAAALLHAARVRHAGRQATGRVTLILPLTGPAPGLEALFAALAAQTLRPRRLIVAIEDRADPAWARVLAAAPLLPCPVRIVAAGRSDRRGQKCTNLIAGFRLVDAADDAVVMFDADIRPQPWWLATLASPALDGAWDLVTGYRWPLPGAAGPAAQMLAWADRAFGLLPKFRWGGLVWGGSLAFSRAALDRLDVPAVLDPVLSDDLAIGSAARRAGLRVLTRRILLLPTPHEGGSARFMLRQLRIAHLHRPLPWRLALAIQLGEFAGLAALLALAPGSPLAQGLILGLLALRLLRWRLHDRLGRLLGAPDPPAARWRQAMVALAPPAVSLLVLWLMVRALATRRLVWRHVTYRLEGPERVFVLSRADPSAHTDGRIL